MKETNILCLKVRNVAKRYKVEEPLLENVSFEINDGERIAILGENGAGKTTFLKTIVGIIKPDKGEILFNGIDIWEDPNVKREIGYMGAEHFFYEKLTVRENLTLISALYGMHQINKKIEEFGLRLHISDSLDKPIQELSSGMKRKVQIISAFMHEPNLVILDEPFNTLDIETTKTLTELMKNYKGAILFTTHEIVYVREVANKVFKVDKGTLIAENNL